MSGWRGKWARAPPWSSRARPVRMAAGRTAPTRPSTRWPLPCRILREGQICKVKFPVHVHQTAAEYWASYIEAVAAAAKRVDPAKIERAADVLNLLFSAGRTLYVCGNGGPRRDLEPL